MGKAVLVVGGGDTAADTALALRKAGADVTLAHRRDSLRARDGCREELEKAGVKMLWNSEAGCFTGSGRVAGVELSGSDGRKSSLKIDAAVISIGSVPFREWLEGLGLKMDGMLVAADENGMTSVPGIFAAGDIVSKIKRIPQALATGERAAYGAYKHLRNPYWK